MSEWKLVTEPPERPMKVLFYAATAEYREYGSDVPFVHPPLEDPRYETGYWTGKEFRYDASNHEVFELDEPGENINDPTHWTPLQAPPAALTKQPVDSLPGTP